MNTQTFRRLDATDLAELIQKKEVTAVELLDLSFQVAKELNPPLNAIIHMRKKAVYEEAQKLDCLNLPLAGVPILLKNISQAIKDEPMTAGAKLLKGNIAKQTSNFVSKLQKAGCLIIGHTNTPEFGLKNITEPKLHGVTRNPSNTEYSAGGSSGGAAAAVASGIVPVAGASDGGGSIRIPASFTNIFGLKPTRGRTPVGPGIGRQWQGASIDFVVSRTVRDSAAMLDELQVIQPEAAFQVPLFAGSYTEQLKRPWVKPLRIGFTTESPVGTPVSTEARKAVNKTMTWLEQQGHHVEERNNDVDGIGLMKNYYLMNCGEISAMIQSMEKMLGRKVTPGDVEIETWLLHEAGKSVSAAEFTGSLASWDRAAAQMASYHEKYDFFVTPATAFSAPKIGELSHSTAEQERLQEQMAKLAGDVTKQQQLIYEMFLPSLTYTPFTQLANLTGQPAMSVPVHLTEEGLPIGVQFMATKGREDSLLKIAWQFEQSAIWEGNR
ncbi:amidase [Salipaludibacillus sp. CF4.18]|uniref:amidase n=1 Tax=Salipaludibacillus sp. CF4.18 TaxID=3373081 RepID=UPI003EE7EC40